MYAATISYALMTLFIKLSILSLIARVFAPYKRRMQGIYVLGALLIAYYLTSLVLKIRVCWPISAYWRGDQSKCLNQSAVITADAIISTVTDAIILVLPLPLTWSLQLPPKKKMRVGSMLAVGGLATAFSAWRLHLILTDGHSPDSTILFVQVVLSGYVNKQLGQNITNQSQQRGSWHCAHLHLPARSRRPVQIPSRPHRLQLCASHARQQPFLHRRHCSYIKRSRCVSQQNADVLLEHSAADLIR